MRRMCLALRQLDRVYVTGVVDGDANAEVSQYLQLVHIPFAHQRNEKMFFFVLPVTPPEPRRSRTSCPT